MKSIFKILASCFLIVGMFSQYTATGAAANVVRIKGLGTTAYFYSESPDGCIETGVSLFANQQAELGTGAPAVPMVYLDIDQYNACTDEAMIVALGQKQLSKDEFTVAGNLASATLNTTVNVYDGVSGTAFDVTIHLTWAPTSGIIRENSHYNYMFEDCHDSYTNVSTMRAAAATGTISYGTTNIIPLPSFDGKIYDSKGGEISHGC